MKFTLILSSTSMFPAFFNGSVCLLDLPSGAERLKVYTRKKKKNSSLSILERTSEQVLMTECHTVFRCRYNNLFMSSLQYHWNQTMCCCLSGCVWTEMHHEPSESFTTCRSFGACTLAVPHLALRGTLKMTWLGPGESSSTSTRAMNSSAGPSSPKAKQLVG